MKRISFYIFSLFLLLGLLIGCSSAPKADKAAQDTSKPAAQATDSKDKEITLATTTSTQDSGLLDYMVPIFEKQTGIKVKVVAVGTGQAIKIGQDGNADVLLVHARSQEDKFVQDGYGVDAYDVMYNQFYLVGPEKDPAGVKNVKTAAEALKLISDKKSTFISRGDESGTHTKEKSIWKAVGINPEGEWYVKAGQGMGATLQMADEKGGYTLTDEATFLSHKGKLGLQVVLQGDPLLFNPYGIMKVKSTKKSDSADQLIHFFVDENGQKLISEFGKDKYGKGLFVPSAKKR
ncbi:MAG TPA: substrate-binding domain-containing protein [Bacillota bacterium]|nr:substrate-binding domain-containing protein [Bacillota bacterium]